MAGDWIKFEKTTPDKPEVFEMAGILQIDPDAVVGKLLRVWNWFDDHSRNGHAPVTLLSFIDRCAGVAGFGDAMVRVGWMEKTDQSLILPNFDRHNGQPAKVRALAANRKQRERSRGHAESHAPAVTDNATAARPEKEEREDINPPLFPLPGETNDHGRCLPREWRSMTREERKRRRVESNTPTMETIGKFLGRKPGTLWTVAEAVALWEVKPKPEEVELLARYYALMPDDPERDYRRRKIETLLNNWNGELDKARCHFANHAA